MQILYPLPYMPPSHSVPVASRWCPLMCKPGDDSGADGGRIILFNAMYAKAVSRRPHKATKVGSSPTMATTQRAL